MIDGWTIRIATGDDAGAVADIYGEYVRTSTATFEEDAPSANECRLRIENTLAQYPFLVVCDQSLAVVGFCYAHALRERSAYLHSAETTIYLSSRAQHTGVAAALYTELERILARQGVTNLYACITGENEVSLRFHSTCGYARCAQFNSCGYKFNRWLDIIWMEKLIADHGAPAPFIPFSQLSHAQ